MSNIGPKAYDIDCNKLNAERINTTNNNNNNKKLNADLVTKRHRLSEERRMRESRELGPGSYDTLYSEDNIKVHTPGVVMRSASM